MDTSNSITAAVFIAFLKCPTKAHLLAIGEPAPATFFTDIEARIASMYKSAVTRRAHIRTEAAKPLDFGELSSSREHGAIAHPVDCETTIYHIVPTSHEPEHCQSPESTPSGTFVPTLYSPWDKPDVFDSLVVCFGAVALLQVTGILPDIGTVIYGDGHRRKTVKIGDHTVRTRETIDAIAVACNRPEPPPLLLNKHCAVCDFQQRCRDLALERDNLSLLSAMTDKERAKFHSKGIFSITQLSYGYRPRRRKRKRPDGQNYENSSRRTTPIVRNDHKLKALAVKKNQIHVVGTPSVKFNGTPTFLDVEGMPDRGFYYLIGLRFESGGRQAERSFWADRLDDERTIWENCLRELKAIGNAQIISYGAYETRFLRQMRTRYILAPDDVEFIDRLIETSVNLVGFIYGKIYFPTFSNSLKEVGRYLGFEWTWVQASGAATPLLRRAWELGADDGLKGELIGYNMDDCRAAARVADALGRIWGSGASGLDAVDVSSLEVNFKRTFEKFDSALPEFGIINSAAYWDYQRSKVYARTYKAVRRNARKPQRKSKRATVDKEITVGELPETCPRCLATRIGPCRSGSQVVHDLKFTRRGIKRWSVRYRYKVSMQGMPCRDQHIFAGFAVRSKPAILCRLSFARITPIEPKGGRAHVVAVRFVVGQTRGLPYQVGYG